MSATIYEHKSYKKFLNDLILTYPNGGRGIRRELAKAMRCQVPYVSHVLSGRYDFSAEQGEAACRYFGLPKEDIEYFLLLLAENRAGTSELKRLYSRMLEKSAEDHLRLKQRLKIKDTLSAEDQAIYYSHWHYAAIHMLTTIPEFQTKEAIAKRLLLAATPLLEALEFLTTRGLLKKNGVKYESKQTLLHLERDSPLLARHHANWRLRAIQALADEKAHDIHYSSAFTCSTADLPKVREILVRCLEECTQLIRPSKEEQAAGLCIDLFEL